MLYIENIYKAKQQKAINTNTRTIVKVRRDENVNMELLSRICRYFKFDI